MAKYKAYSEYKDSGVEWLGDIPNDWDIKSLKNIAVIVNGSTPKSGVEEYWDGDINWITPTDLSQKLDVYLKDSQRKITNEGLNSCGTSLVPENTVILSTRAPIGSLAITGAQSCTNQGCKSLVVRYKDHCLFLYYYLSISTNSLNNLGRGSTFLELSTEDLGSFKVPMPNEGIGKKVSFLDHETARIDNLIEKQQQLIELLKEKRQAVISHAVTKGLNPDVPMKDSGVEWLGKVPEHWRICRIKQLSLQISKGTTPSTIGGDFVDEGIRFLKAENIGKSKEVNFSPQFYITNFVDKQISRSRLQERDVLVIIAGATTGMASILQKDLLPANTNQAVSFIRPNNVDFAEWIYYWLGTGFTQSIIWMGAVQAAQPNLSMESLGNIPILVPPQDETKSICLKIEKQSIEFENLISKAELAIELMQERRSALISAAVTGKIDVRDWVAPDTSNFE
ncbi:restriction endonuclease subunit S [Buttiauxella agrestis]